MALPLTRNTTYGSSDQVKSADLNDIQDQIIAFWTDRPRKVYIPGNHAIAAEIADTWIRQVAGSYTAVSTHDAVMRLPDTLVVGATIVSITVYLETSSTAGSRSAGLAENGFNMVGLNTVAYDSDSTVSSPVNLSLAAGLPYVIQDAFFYFLWLELFASDILRCVGIEYLEPQ